MPEMSAEQAVERIKKLDGIIRHQCDDWAECDDALEKAGIVMNPDGYRKTHVDAVGELAAELIEARRRIEALENVLRGVLHGSYLDDDVINRHGMTTISCAALKAVNAALNPTPEQP